MSPWMKRAGRVRWASRFVAAALALGAGPAGAGEADVLDVAVSRDEAGAYRFEVTVRHDDAGWEHFANRWEIVAPDGEVLATRALRHPHDTEQPFTRSLSGVMLPDDIDHVVVRAHDSRHQLGGQEVRVDLER